MRNQPRGRRARLGAGGAGTGRTPAGLPAIPPPVVGPPPADGRTIAALIHGGSTDSLYAAEQQLGQQATELSATADQMHSSAGRLD